MYVCNNEKSTVHKLHITACHWFQIIATCCFCMFLCFLGRFVSGFWLLFGYGGGFCFCLNFLVLFKKKIIWVFICKYVIVLGGFIFLLVGVLYCVLCVFVCVCVCVHVHVCMCVCFLGVEWVCCCFVCFIYIYILICFAVVTLFQNVLNSNLK